MLRPKAIARQRFRESVGLSITAKGTDPVTWILLLLSVMASVICLQRRPGRSLRAVAGKEVGTSEIRCPSQRKERLPDWQRIVPEKESPSGCIVKSSLATSRPTTQVPLKWFPDTVARTAQPTGNTAPVTWFPT